MYYKLVNQKPVKCGIDEVSNDDHYIVALNNIGNVKISTVFLRIDHQYGDGPPILFETMIFGGQYDDYQQRYSTWEEAASGHRVAVALVSETDESKKKIASIGFAQLNRNLDI